MINLILNNNCLVKLVISIMLFLIVCYLLDNGYGKFSYTTNGIINETSIFVPIGIIIIIPIAYYKVLCKDKDEIKND